jgi:hypothetical protein
VSIFRRDFLKLATAGAAMAVHTTGAQGQTVPMPCAGMRTAFDVKQYGAKGDGASIDTAAINRAIEAASSSGGGTVHFPSGTYACYSIQLKSNVALCLDQGATIVAAEVSEGGTPNSNCYDDAEQNGAWEGYSDFGHSHWHNSLIWGEGLQNIAILGSGLIWGRGLSRGTGPSFSAAPTPRAENPGMGNKTIALKSCHNVILRDFSILKGGHLGILATGVDNLTIDNLKIDTNRDGMDVDCCRNVRIANCSVNSPGDDGICLKSSFALGYTRATENVTITNCYVTGAYFLGTMLDGTWKRWPAGSQYSPTGRIKCGTESNGGFKNITISNCVFDGCRGFALESVDGGLLEDVTFTGITMRDCVNTPIFLRLGARMRGPAGIPVGTMKRIMISNVVSHNSESRFGGAGFISGIPGHLIEDVQINNIYMDHRGGGTKEMADRLVDEQITGYPEPYRFGDVPAGGFYVRNVKNIEFSNMEIAWDRPDARPVFLLRNVDGAEFFRIKTPKGLSNPVFDLDKVQDFSVTSSRSVKDTYLKSVEKGFKMLQGNE